MDQTSGGGDRRLALHLVLAVFALLVVGGGFYAVSKGIETPREEGFQTIVKEVVKSLPPEEMQTLIGNAILQSYSEYRGDAIRWSATYHACLFFAAALSAFAGLVLKLDFFLKNPDLKKDLAAFSAVSSALLITFSTIGDFQTHWQADRLAAAQMESLGYEFVTTLDRKDAVAYFSLKIREIGMTRNQQVVGSNERPPSPRVAKPDATE